MKLPKTAQNYVYLFKKFGKGCKPTHGAYEFGCNARQNFPCWFKFQTTLLVQVSNLNQPFWSPITLCPPHTALGGASPP